MPGNYEIERKFLIKYPEAQLLESIQDVSEITQTYLLSTGDGFSRRVRKRGREGEYVYYYTQKKHVNNIRRIELESVISEEEYLRLLASADPDRNVILKTRYCLNYKGQHFEIDVFPFWSDRAVIELELEDEGQEIFFPESIKIIKEVTDDKRYTNASLARSILYEEL